MIFLDNASTTKVYDEVLDVYNKYSKELFFNPSAQYKCSSFVKQDITKTEKNILKFINAPINSKLIFTSCATESNNMAILCSLNKRFKKVLISVGEHSSVYNLAQEITNRGYQVEYINLQQDGKVDIQDLKNKMTSEVGVVAIMHVSNETGAINDIEQLVKIVKEVNPLCHFHCDGVQAICKINVDVKKLNVDTYTFSGHKIHAPKGIAGLYVKNKISPLLIGGGQQNGLRSGTENVPGIMSLNKAIELTKISNCFEYVKELNTSAREILSSCDGITINSALDNSPYILSISMRGVNGSTIVDMLDDYDICIGLGSACSTKKAGNVTLEAMGKNNADILGSVRISFSADNTINEVKEACNRLIECYKKLKTMLRK